MTTGYRSLEVILKWHDIFVDFFNSGETQVAYCKNNNINYSTFISMYYRIVYKSRADKKLYLARYQQYCQFKNLDITAKEFCRQNNMSLTAMTEMSAHLYYRNIVEAHNSNFYTVALPKDIPEYAPKKLPSLFSSAIPKELMEQPAMSFIAINNNEPEPEPIIATIEPEKPKNNLELSIGTGIKVTIEPNIESQKILKIIELLKDL